MASVFGILPPMVLTTVVQLDVLEIIKQAGDGAHLSPSEIAAKLPTNNPDAAGLLDGMLALLASYDIVSCTTRTLPSGRLERLYGLAPVCQFLTQTHDGATLKSSVLLTHDLIMIDNWLHLKDVLSGETTMEKTKGVEHVAGDMFVSVPKGDAIFLKWTLGDWEDDLCCKILKNCYDALPDNGKVIVCEYILPQVPNSKNASRLVFGLKVTRATALGGKERTEEEYKALAQQARFKECKVSCSVYDFKIMEFTKNS